MPTLGIALPLVPLRVGDVVQRAAWVPHVTLVGNLRLPQGGEDVAAELLRRAVGAAPRLEMVVGEEAWFGSDGSVRVDLVEAPAVVSLHRRLLASLAGVDGFALVEPAHAGDGYRPHRTVVAGPRPARGDLLEASTAVLVELDPAGRPGTAVVLAVAEVGAAPSATEFDAAAVHGVLGALAAADVRAWVVGGWGVDALAGRTTRAHHDLDLLVDADRVEAAIAAMAPLGFAVRSVWSENRWTSVHGRLVPSAFIAADADGREVDVHTVRILDDRVLPVSASSVDLPAGTLEATGSIGGRPVRCATAAAQLVMHTGYPLPERQVADVALLRRLLER
ncbi:nucleotidyltransferase domain-containing protein [uncultured Amnibacterium sp.]|uniref:nucleotidyltransferase domain-containing protein n=1 Tax=uncultured Amnibacterium sp. TaxID=1631851 RepID=UPI0035CC6028